jgi:hypothetical protein
VVAIRPPFAAGARLRFVAVGSSIVSDWANPVATSARAVLNAIATSGHEVTFLEQRGNPALTALLANRGSRAYKAFTERYPAIRLRTYDLPRGWQRTIWFAAEIATADAVIALPGMPPELLPEIAGITSPHIVQLFDESHLIEHSGFRLVRLGMQSHETDLVFGPTVETGHLDPANRSDRPLLVAYDDAEEAERLAAELAESDPVRIVTGTANLPGWEYIPEIDLPGLYGAHRTAFVIGAGDSAWSDARRLLPRASGSAVADAPGSTPAASLPGGVDAAEQASAIVQRVRERLRR